MSAGVGKSRWTPDEDAALLTQANINKAAKVGAKLNWQEISDALAASGVGRTAKQCRERWKGAVDPELNRAPWSPEDLANVDALMKEHGHQWGLISKLLGSSRSELMVRNLYYSRQRKQERRGGGASRVARKPRAPKRAAHADDGEEQEEEEEEEAPASRSSRGSGATSLTGKRRARGTDSDGEEEDQDDDARSVGSKRSRTSVPPSCHGSDVSGDDASDYDGGGWGSDASGASKGSSRRRDARLGAGSVSSSAAYGALAVGRHGRESSSCSSGCGGGGSASHLFPSGSPPSGDYFAGGPNDSDDAPVMVMRGSGGGGSGRGGSAQGGWSRSASGSIFPHPPSASSGSVAVQAHQHRVSPTSSSTPLTAEVVSRMGSLRIIEGSDMTAAAATGGAGGRPHSLSPTSSRNASAHDLVAQLAASVQAAAAGGNAGGSDLAVVMAQVAALQSLIAQGGSAGEDMVGGPAAAAPSAHSAAASYPRQQQQQQQQQHRVRSPVQMQPALIPGLRAMSSMDDEDDEQDGGTKLSAVGGGQAKLSATSGGPMGLPGGGYFGLSPSFGAMAAPSGGLPPGAVLMTANSLGFDDGLGMSLGGSTRGAVSQDPFMSPRACAGGAGSLLSPGLDDHYGGAGFRGAAEASLGQGTAPPSAVPRVAQLQQPALGRVDSGDILRFLQ